MLAVRDGGSVSEEDIFVELTGGLKTSCTGV